MNKLLNFEWLIGLWEGIHGQGIYHEEWVKNNSGELSGKAYFIKKGEMLNTEKLKIHKIEENIFYTADVSHNPNPVSFKLISRSDKVFVFENPDHDFPQKITYERKSDESLYATVEAVVNGKAKRIDYSLRLVK